MADRSQRLPAAAVDNSTLHRCTTRLRGPNVLVPARPKGSPKSSALLSARDRTDLIEAMQIILSHYQTGGTGHLSVFAPNGRTGLFSSVAHHSARLLLEISPGSLYRAMDSCRTFDSRGSTVYAISSFDKPTTPGSFHSRGCHNVLRSVARPREAGYQMSASLPLPGTLVLPRSWRHPCRPAFLRPGHAVFTGIRPPKIAWNGPAMRVL
jgi:hypothetical protein